MGIDQGTSGTTVVALDDDLLVTHTASRKVSSLTTDDQGVEQDPALVLESVTSALGEVVAGLGHTEIHAVGFDHQGETVLAWDKRSLEPLTPAIVWSDRRPLGVAERLMRAGLAEAVASLSSNPLDPYFCAAKYAWLLDCDPVLRSKEVALGTLETWLLAQLGIEPATDVGTASRTQLTQLGSLEWDPDLLGIFGIPSESLAPIVPSLIDRGPMRVEGIHDELPLMAVLVDQPAALVGNGGLFGGATKVTYGTGAFVVSNAGREPPSSPSRLVVSVGWGDEKGPVYIYDGGVFSAGAGLDWLSSLGIDVSPDAHMRLKGRAPTGVKILPALHGLGAPHWNRDARAALLGLEASSTGDDILQAFLDAICFRVAEIFEELETDAGLIRVDGGLTRSPYLVQAQADVLGIPIGLGRSEEATAIGAALLAGLQVGAIAEGDMLAATGPSTIIEPSDTAARDRYAAWRAAFASLSRAGDLP